MFWRGVGTFITFHSGNDSRDQTRWTSRGLLPAFSSPPWGRSALRLPERASVASNHSQHMNQVRGRWPRRPVVSGQTWQAPAEAGDPMILRPGMIGGSLAGTPPASSTASRQPVNDTCWHQAADVPAGRAPHISLTGLLNTGPLHLTPSTACSGDAAPVISSRRWRDHRMVDRSRRRCGTWWLTCERAGGLEAWVGEDLDTDVAGASGQLLADGGGPCPTDALGRPHSRFRPGDVLRVSCPLRETEVVDANRFHVCVRWPWRWLQEAQDRQDQASGVDNSKWRGQLCFDRDKDHPDAGWLFQLDPGLPVL